MSRKRKRKEEDEEDTKQLTFFSEAKKVKCSRKSDLTTIIYWNPKDPLDIVDDIERHLRFRCDPLQRDVSKDDIIRCLWIFCFSYIWNNRYFVMFRQNFCIFALTELIGFQLHCRWVGRLEIFHNLKKDRKCFWSLTDKEVIFFGCKHTVIISKKDFETSIVSNFLICWDTVLQAYSLTLSNHEAVLLLQERDAPFWKAYPYAINTEHQLITKPPIFCPMPSSSTREIQMQTFGDYVLVDSTLYNIRHQTVHKINFWKLNPETSKLLENQNVSPTHWYRTQCFGGYLFVFVHESDIVIQFRSFDGLVFLEMNYWSIGEPWLEAKNSKNDLWVEDGYIWIVDSSKSPLRCIGYPITKRYNFLNHFIPFYQDLVLYFPSELSGIICEYLYGYERREILGPYFAVTDSDHMSHGSTVFTFHGGDFKSVTKTVFRTDSFSYETINNDVGWMYLKDVIQNKLIVHMHDESEAAEECT